MRDRLTVALPVDSYQLVDDRNLEIRIMPSVRPVVKVSQKTQKIETVMGPAKIRSIRKFLYCE